MKSINFTSLIFYLFSFLFLSNIQAQTTVFVSPLGDDTNKGSIDKPVQSMHKALSIAKATTEPEVEILLREGIYYQKSPLLIGAIDFDNRSLTISAYNNEHVVLSGGNLLHPNWQKVKGEKFFKTKVPHTNFDQLFINGVKRILARYPNYKEDVILNGTAEGAISKERIRLWKNPAGGYIHSLHAREWGGMHYRIKGKKNGELIYEGGFQNNRPSAMHPSFRCVENIYEELDAPGEWYLDKEKQTLYYYPFKNEDLDDAVIETSNLTSLIELTGNSDKPIKNITIKNIQFAHTRRTFMEDYEPLTRSDWQIHRGGAVFMKNAESCSIENCEFANLGGNAVLGIGA